MNDVGILEDRTSPEYAICNKLWKLPNKYIRVLDKRFLLNIYKEEFLNRLSEQHAYLDYLEHQDKPWEVSYYKCSLELIEALGPRAKLIISMRYRQMPYFRIALVRIFTPKESVSG